MVVKNRRIINTRRRLAKNLSGVRFINGEREYNKQKYEEINGESISNHQIGKPILSSDEMQMMNFHLQNKLNRDKVRLAQLNRNLELSNKWNQQGKTMEMYSMPLLDFYQERGKDYGKLVQMGGTVGAKGIGVVSSAIQDIGDISTALSYVNPMNLVRSVKGYFSG